MLTRRAPTTGSPAIAASDGRLICLSTPHGRRGFFYEAWCAGGDEWTRICVPASQVSRIRPEFLAQERLTDEHYCREKPLSYHAQYLPRNVTWYADPSGAGDISELKCAGFVVRKGNNSLGTGIPAVHARLNDGRLRILHGRCPNLLAEAALYAYERDAKRTESPADEHNHALDALRYLISILDARKLALFRRKGASGGTAPPNSPPQRKPWLRLDNEALWTPLWPG